MKNATTVELECNRLHETYEFDKIAKQASGAVMYRQGNAVLIAAVGIEETPVEEEFLPLTVQYIEKAYAAAKIPGGFVKRETKPGDFETLTSRIIDRALRPLFPKEFRYPVSITIMVVSSDSEVDLQVAALHAASAALFVSDVPLRRFVSAIRIGRMEGEWHINPSLSQMAQSTLDLLVAGAGDEVVMIEMRTVATRVVDEINIDGVDAMLGASPVVSQHQEANALDEDTLVEAIALAQKALAEANRTYEEVFASFVREPLALEVPQEARNEALEAFIAERFGAELQDAVSRMAKAERSQALKALRVKIAQTLVQEGHSVDDTSLKAALEAEKRRVVRRMILEQGIRADGRALDEIRPVTIETNILPSVHGSCLFTRGQTQVLVTATLGDKKDAQMYELLTDKHAKSERFMVHYNFPGFSVGEVTFIAAPGRRELGHGNLAKRALEPTLPIDYHGTVRLVSEVLESNGSSSMATVCAGSLALRSAEVETTDLVAGIAMGVVVEGDKHAILSDIMGLEDHDGDMDFKIAGTREGFTALQMDIKLGGVSLPLLKETLAQARRGTLHLLDIMEDAAQKIQKSQALPTVEHFSINPSKIGDIIGRAGATIRDIIERFEVTVDIDKKEGGVKVSGHDEEKVAAAKKHIQTIASAPEEEPVAYETGKRYQGKIKRIVDFGIFVEMPNGGDALLHISKVAKGRVDDLHTRYKEGEPIDVIVLEQEGRKIELATPEYLA